MGAQGGNSSVKASRVKFLAMLINQSYLGGPIHQKYSATPTPYLKQAVFKGLHILGLRNKREEVGGMHISKG